MFAFFAGAIVFTMYNYRLAVKKEKVPARDQKHKVNLFIENGFYHVPLDQLKNIDDKNYFSYGCMTNIDRLMDQNAETSTWNKYVNKESKFVDETFPAENDIALYWPNYLDRDAAEMVNSTDDEDGYENIEQWLRPDQFDQSRKPSLWGDKGINPNGIV